MSRIMLTVNETNESNQTGKKKWKNHMLFEAYLSFMILITIKNLEIKNGNESRKDIILKKMLSYYTT